MSTKFLIIILFFFSNLLANSEIIDQKFKNNMVKNSALIVEAKVIDIYEKLDKANVRIKVIRAEVIDKIAGDFSNKEILLEYPIDFLPDIAWKEPNFKIDEEFITFLEKNNENSWMPIAGAMGKYKTNNDKIDGTEILKSKFKNDIKNYRSGNSINISFPNQHDVDGDVTYTSKLDGEFSIIGSNFYGPAQGTLIEFHLNPTGALDKEGNQLSFEVVRTAIQRAIDAWNNVFHSYATFSISSIQYTGGKNVSDNISTITFEEYYCNGATYLFNTNVNIQAIDIVFSSGYTEGTARSLRWNTDDTYPSSYISYQCPFPTFVTGGTRPNIGPVDLSDVAAHELGHAVGLGHVSLSTYTMVPTSYTADSWWTKTWRRSLEVGDMAGKIYQDPYFPNSTTQTNAKILMSSRSSTSFLGGFTIPSGYSFEIESGKTLQFYNVVLL